MSSHSRVFGPSERMLAKSASTASVGSATSGTSGTNKCVDRESLSGPKPKAGAKSGDASSAAGSSKSGDKKSSSRSSSPEPKASAKKKPEDTSKSSKPSTPDKRRTEKAGKDKVATAQEVCPEGTIYAQLGKLKDLAGDLDAQTELLRRKMKECCAVYDFTRAEAQQAEKEGKRITLLEILENWPSVSSKKEEPKKEGADVGAGGSAGASQSSSTKEGMQMTPEIFASAVELLKKNAFRNLTHRERTPMDLQEGEDEEPVLEVTWPHLELAYEIFLKIISYKDLDAAMVMKNGLDKHFLNQFLSLLESDDPREREVAKNILQKAWSRVPGLRTTVRRSIHAFCLKAVHLTGDEAPHNGVSEVLDVLLSRIVGGFPSPLKDEHKELFLKVLLPLYKLDTLLFFNSQLQELRKAFIKKEPSLAKHAVNALLRYWPVSAGSKQQFFLSELEDLILTMPSADFKLVSGRVAHKLAACVTCPNSEVAERALSFWRNNDRFVRMTIKECRAEVPLIIHALYENMTTAWHQNVTNKTLEVLRNFMEADSEMFDSSSTRHRKEADEAEKKETLRAKKWSQLEALHKKKVLKGEQRAAAAITAAAQAPEVKTVIKAESSIKVEAGKKTLQNDEMVELMPNSCCGLSLCFDCDPPPARLKVLAVCRNGKIIDSVYADNVTAFGSALRLTPRIPVGFDPKGCGGTIWASFHHLPKNVVLLVYLLVSCDGKAIGTNPKLIADASGGLSLGHCTLDVPEGVRAGVVATISQVGGGAWKLMLKRDFTKSSWQFMDMLEPLLGKVVREALPSLSKRQRLFASFSAMECGSVADMPKLVASKKLYAGLGWDLGPAAGESVNLEVSMVLFDGDGHFVGSACPSHPDSCDGILHTGNGPLSSGGILDFDILAKKAHQIFILGHFPEAGHTFDLVQQPHCSVVDLVGKELARFNLQEEKSKPGVIMGRFMWQSQRSRWTFQALGSYCDGNSWKESLDDLTSLFKRPPREFQMITLEDDGVSYADASTTAGGSEWASVVISL